MDVCEHWEGVEFLFAKKKYVILVIHVKLTGADNNDD